MHILDKLYSQTFTDDPKETVIDVCVKEIGVPFVQDEFTVPQPDYNTDLAIAWYIYADHNESLRYLKFLWISILSAILYSDADEFTKYVIFRVDYSKLKPEYRIFLKEFIDFLTDIGMKVRYTKYKMKTPDPDSDILLNHKYLVAWDSDAFIWSPFIKNSFWSQIDQFIKSFKNPVYYPHISNRIFYNLTISYFLARWNSFYFMMGYKSKDEFLNSYESVPKNTLCLLSDRVKEDFSKIIEYISREIYPIPTNEGFVNKVFQVVFGKHFTQVFHGLPTWFFKSKVICVLNEWLLENLVQFWDDEIFYSLIKSIWCSWDELPEMKLADIVGFEVKDFIYTPYALNTIHGIRHGIHSQAVSDMELILNGIKKHFNNVDK